MIEASVPGRYDDGMSALNVEFSDEELATLREIAREAGMPMKAFVRASTTDAIARHQALREGAEVFRRVFADPQLADAIEAAGLDDGPKSGTAGRAA